MTKLLQPSFYLSGGYSVEWHPSRNGHPWADENPDRWWEIVLGDGEWKFLSFNLLNHYKSLKSMLWYGGIITVWVKQKFKRFYALFSVFLIMGIDHDNVLLSLSCILMFFILPLNFVFFLRHGTSLCVPVRTQTTLSCRKLWSAGLSTCSNTFCPAIWKSSMRLTAVIWRSGNNHSPHYTLQLNFIWRLLLAVGG